MDFAALLIGLGVIVALFIIGKIFAILTKIFLIIIVVAILAVGVFFWQNNTAKEQHKTGYAVEYCLYNV